MPKSPQRRDDKKAGKTLKEKREAKKSKQQDKEPIGNWLLAWLVALTSKRRSAQRLAASP
jgi:hypothetical protein